MIMIMMMMRGGYNGDNINHADNDNYNDLNYNIDNDDNNDTNHNDNNDNNNNDNPTDNNEY